jgi:hypothetical protein
VLKANGFGIFILIYLKVIQDSVQTLLPYHDFITWLKKSDVIIIDSKKFSIFTDDKFKDKLHFNNEGGKEFSSELGALLNSLNFK